MSLASARSGAGSSWSTRRAPAARWSGWSRWSVIYLPLPFPLPLTWWAGCGLEVVDTEAALFDVVGVGLGGAEGVAALVAALGAELGVPLGVAVAAGVDAGRAAGPATGDCITPARATAPHATRATRATAGTASQPSRRPRTRLAGRSAVRGRARVADA